MHRHDYDRRPPPSPSLEEYLGSRGWVFLSVSPDAAFPWQHDTAPDERALALAPAGLGRGLVLFFAGSRQQQQVRLVAAEADLHHPDPAGCPASLGYAGWHDRLFRRSPDFVVRCALDVAELACSPIAAGLLQ
ncbi:hypothetical protein KCU88_g6699, partial [Aureobasidium melanogenum]